MTDLPDLPGRVTLERRQAESFGMRPPTRLSTPREAEAYLKRVGVALRYQATPTLKLGSIRSAVGPTPGDRALETSIALTNHLLETATGIEVTVVAGRPALVHRSVMPALYRLVRRERAPDDRTGLGLHARSAAALLDSNGAVTAGVVRRHLGVPATPRHDPGYEAVAELQRHLLVDRGPFVVPPSGIPYLSREGYPYRFFHVMHVDLVRAARRLSIDRATDDWIRAYLAGAIFASRRTLVSLFRSFLSPTEIAASLDRLTRAGAIATGTSGRDTIAVFENAGTPRSARR